MADLGQTHLYTRHVGRRDSEICCNCHMEYVPEEVVWFEGSYVCPFCDTHVEGFEKNAK